MKNWDAVAQGFLESGAANKDEYYLKKAYAKAVKTGFKHVGPGEINLLKVDLWNEGIMPGRDLLADCQKNKKINVFGMDFSKVVCSAAKSRLKRVHIAQADIRNMPFANNSFDLLLDISTIDHVPWLQAKKALQEYSRVLGNNGVLVLVFWYDCFAVRHIRHDRENDLQYFFQLKEAKAEIKKRFEVLEEYCIHSLSAVPKRFSPKKWPSWFLDLLLALEFSVLSRLLLKELSGLYVLVGKKKG